jgi:hypothetical protein
MNISLPIGAATDPCLARGAMDRWPNGAAMDPWLAAALKDDDVLAGWHGVLRRTLRALSTTELAALAAGLSRHRGNLIAGRLFSLRGGGGCAVGVMLLELKAVPRRGIGFWTRHGWRRSSASYGAARNHPRLRHLEWAFDRSVERARQTTGRGRREAIDAVGRWFEVETDRAVAWRRLAGETHPGEGADQWQPSATPSLRSSSSSP